MILIFAKIKKLMEQDLGNYFWRVSRISLHELISSLLWWVLHILYSVTRYHCTCVYFTQVVTVSMHFRSSTISVL